MKSTEWLVLGFGLSCALVACDGEDTPDGAGAAGAAGAPGAAGNTGGGAGGSAGGADSGGAGSGGAENGGEAGSGAVGAAGEKAEGGTGGADDPTPLELPEFSLRTPVEHSITCSEYTQGFPEDPQPFSDKDFICSFEHGGVEAVIYLQATPIDCVVIMGAVPTYETTGAWISVDGELRELAPVSYDGGGNHGNDSLDFELAGTRYRYYHSSFGFGWRACQPMDCLQVMAEDGRTVAEDGCTPERTLPVICVEVQPDGSVPPLVDTFARCMGDENAG